MIFSHEPLSIVNWASFVSDILTVLASSIAIFLFVTKRKSISLIYNRLINFSYQLTLSELEGKLDRLNDLNARNQDDHDKIHNILSDINGQIRGNEKLREFFSEQRKVIDKIIAGNIELQETVKRALVSELRERIRHLNVQNIDELAGE